jgi:hypothetical protein
MQVQERKSGMHALHLRSHAPGLSIDISSRRGRDARFVFSLIGAVSIFCFANARLLAADREISFGTQYQERVFQVRNGVFTTRELQNKFSASQMPVLPRIHNFRTMEVTSSEFAIHLGQGLVLTAYDFVYHDHHVDRGKENERLTVHLVGRTVPLHVTLVYYAEQDKPWMRKSVQISPSSARARQLVVEQIDVERLGFIEGEADGGGIGQPVFLSTRNSFFGLEYPEGHNDYSGGVIKLSHYPGKQLSQGLESKSAVWGAAPDGQSKREFLEQYVLSFALHPPPEPVVTFRDPWNSGSSPNEAIIKESISILKEKLIDGQGVKIDIYGIDGSGWYDPASILEVNRVRFPRGLDPLVKLAEAAGMEMGLWVSLTGADMNSYWGLAHGLEVVRGDEVFGPYCIAGPKYRTALKAALEHYLDLNRVSNFKFDYNTFSCRQSGHGHSTEALPAREAAIDGYIDVLQSIHTLRPAATIELTSGMWLSPWWLHYADWVWLGGSDLDFLTDSGKASLSEPELVRPARNTRRAQEISYRDSVMWEDFRKQQYTFPLWALVAHGFYNWVLIGGAPDPEAGIEGKPDCCDEPLSDFADHVVTVLMRGTADWELLLNLHQMTSEKWDLLGSGLKWGRQHWDILSTTQMILGNPSKGEVYGYMHFRPTGGIFSLRNPASSQKDGDVVLDHENGVWDMPPAGLRARQIYPCEQVIPGIYRIGDTIRVALAAHETKVIELGEFLHEPNKLLAQDCKNTR